jgi:antitoxin component of RelBE/YafQ-DinJ toxin-antitoxin module
MTIKQALRLTTANGFTTKRIPVDLRRVRNAGLKAEAGTEV